MGKFNNLKILKKTKARTSHQCNICGKIINQGDYYYKEHIKDKFLHSLNAKKFCNECYNKFGDRLINR